MSADVPAPPLSRAQVRQLWAERLQRFADSDLSVAAFCRAEGVPLQTFYYWKRRLAQTHNGHTPDAPRLLPIRLTQPPAPVELLLPGGTRLSLRPGCDLAFVRSLVEALGGTPC